SRSSRVEATRMRRGSIFFSFKNDSSFVVIGGGETSTEAPDVEGDTLFGPEEVASAHERGDATGRGGGVHPDPPAVTADRRRGPRLGPRRVGRGAQGLQKHRLRR